MTPSLVVDNSIVMTWCFQDEANDYADAVLNSLTDAVVIVPSIWPLPDSQGNCSPPVG
ncbi:MAG: hypothetical protein IAE79_19030 [Anaerolinea sp.]|nr:hypothetical protein [Anaerolinea sp.]